MNIREYLKRKYQVTVPTTISHAECQAFQVTWPLKKSWLHDHGGREITGDMAQNAIAALRRRLKHIRSSDRIAHAERGIAILEAHLPAAPLRANGLREQKVWKRSPQPLGRAKASTVHPHSKDDFLFSYEWRRLRMEAIKKYGARCQCCGATPQDGIRINVDHIKPRKLFPELALSLDNLQVLCDGCNHGKGNWDMTDWRGRGSSEELIDRVVRGLLLFPDMAGDLLCSNLIGIAGWEHVIALRDLISMSFDAGIHPTFGVASAYFRGSSFEKRIERAVASVVLSRKSPFDEKRFDELRDEALIAFVEASDIGREKQR